MTAAQTPRTDFVAHENGDHIFNEPLKRFGRMYAHAQILERELAAVRGQLNARIEELGRVKDDFDSAIEQRDRAESALAAANVELDNWKLAGRALHSDAETIVQVARETQAELAAAKAEAETLRDDAERYFYLRNVDGDIAVCKGFDSVDVGSSGVAYTYDHMLTGADLDAAIDAALQAAAGAGPTLPVPAPPAAAAPPVCVGVGRVDADARQPVAAAPSLLAELITSDIARWRKLAADGRLQAAGEPK